MVRALLALLVAFALVSPAGCHKPPPPRIKVAVTLFPIYDLTRTIAGPDADVVLLVPPGRPEREFSAASKEGQAAANAKLGIMVGLGLDDWMSELLDNVAPNARRLSVGDRVPTVPIRKNTIAAALTHQGLPELDPHDDGKPDPYVWMDPDRAALIAKAIAEEMSRADPARSGGYRARASDLTRDLEVLDREVEWHVQSWGSKAFVPLRGAFGYYADRYRLEIPATLETYPGVVPPTRYEQEVVRLMRAKGVSGVFREPQFAPKPAVLVSASAGVPLGTLDALGGQEQTDSYAKLIRFDTEQLEKALKNPVPPKPLEALDGGATTADAAAPPAAHDR